MATIKSFTDIPQSKVLSQILPPKTADMIWVLANPDLPMIKAIAYEDSEKSKYYEILPAWSLAALLSVLPYTITSNDGIAFELNIKKNIIEYSNPSLYLIYKSVKSDNLVDVCYKMILELHELNLL